MSLVLGLKGRRATLKPPHAAASPAMRLAKRGADPAKDNGTGDNDG